MIQDSNQLDDFFGYKPEDDSKLREAKGGKRAFHEFKQNFKDKVRLLPKILSLKERYLIFAFLVVILGSILSTPITAFYHFTQDLPDYGGSFVEGVIGEPRHVNPLLSQASDADRDLVSLIYSGLLKYNEEGKLVPDLAKSYEISSDGLNYTVYLKPNLKWHDGSNLTTDDIIFTIQTAQNSDYGSLQRINWSGVEVQKVDERTIIFKLNVRYAQFLTNLTLGIMPKHIWQDVKPINFALSEFNLKPIGSGPFKFSKLKKDKSGQIGSYELTANDDFYDGRPFIDSVQINFYGTEDELINAYNNNEVENLGFISPSNLSKVKFKQRINIQEIKMPRYFSAFFNTNQSEILANKNIRLALAHATDKNELIQKVLSGNGTSVDSPLIGDVIDVNKDVKKYEFDLELAQKILKETGWGKPNQDGVLTKGSGKNEQKLSIKITTSVWPELAQAADILKSQWQKAGFEVTVEALPLSVLQQTVKERDYQILLFGEILNIDPDPFTLWHSSQKKGSGLNLALYDNKLADSILEEARLILNPIERMRRYDDFQKIIIEDLPAIFLYNPSYLYGQTKDIQGFETKIISTSSDRFSNIEKWYIDTKRSTK
jgi:peptide/nickel transport system substrate-binding protein